MIERIVNLQGLKTDVLNYHNIRVIERIVNLQGLKTSNSDRISFQIERIVNLQGLKTCHTNQA